MAAAKTAHTMLMTQTAQVTTADPTTGRYTVILKNSMPCRLVHPTDAAPATSVGRAELLADRDIWWPGDIALPEQCRFVIAGTSWAPKAGTFAVIGDGVTVVARRAAVVRQQSASF